VLPRGGRRAAAGAGRLVSRTLVQDDSGSVRLSEAAVTAVGGRGGGGRRGGAGLTESGRGGVESVDGVRLRKGRRRLGVELQDGHARAELQLAVAYGRVIPAVAGEGQERGRGAPNGRCG